LVGAVSSVRIVVPLWGGKIDSCGQGKYIQYSVFAWSDESCVWEGLEFPYGQVDGAVLHYLVPKIVVSFSKWRCTAEFCPLQNEFAI
jgi:hypothetical protein